MIWNFLKISIFFVLDVWHISFLLKNIFIRLDTFTRVNISFLIWCCQVNDCTHCLVLQTRDVNFIWAFQCLSWHLWAVLYWLEWSVLEVYRILYAKKDKVVYIKRTSIQFLLLFPRHTMSFLRLLIFSISLSLYTHPLLISLFVHSRSFLIHVMHSNITFPTFLSMSSCKNLARLYFEMVIQKS